MTATHVLLTGGSRGIGRHTAIALARRGCHLALVARSAEDLEKVAREAREAGAGTVHTVAADLADPSAVIRAWLHGWSRLGGVDVLINNAGFNSRRGPFESFGVAEWDAIQAVNLRAPFLLAQQALRDMRGGHILNVLSTASHHAIPFMAPYVAAKMGLLGMTRVLAAEAQRHGIRVTAVSPGATDSGEEGAQPAMRPQSVAEVIAGAVFAPADVMVSEIVIRPTAVDG